MEVEEAAARGEDKGQVPGRVAVAGPVQMGVVALPELQVAPVSLGSAVVAASEIK